VAAAKNHAKSGGRKKGVPNKTTTALKEAILAAAEAAGGKLGLVGYLTTLATENTGAFAALLGKVLPLQIAGDPDNPIRHVISAEPLSEEEWANMHGTK
jgi:hypothetical protein